MRRVGLKDKAFEVIERATMNGPAKIDDVGRRLASAGVDVEAERLPEVILLLGFKLRDWNKKPEDLLVVQA